MLVAGEKGNIDKLVSAIGRPSIHIRVIPYEAGTLIVSLLEDMYVLLERTAMKDVALRDIYEVIFIGKWSDIVKMARDKPPVLLDH